MTYLLLYMKALLGMFLLNNYTSTIYPSSEMLFFPFVSFIKRTNKKGTYDEDIIIDQSYGLTLSGGWDSTFPSQSSTTTVNSLTISNGSITVDNLVIR
jgi:hypothetical protein